MKSQFMLTVAAVLLPSALLAQTQDLPHAQGAPPQAEPSIASVFDALDVDKDGRISRAEAQASQAVSEHFATADANHDGVITREEFSAAFSLPTSGATPPALPR